MVSTAEGLAAVSKNLDWACIWMVAKFNFIIISLSYNRTRAYSKNMPGEVPIQDWDGDTAWAR